MQEALYQVWAVRVLMVLLLQGLALEAIPVLAFCLVLS